MLKDKLTEAERAYLAGLFDGEGTLGYYNYRRNRHEALVAITNTDPRVHRWIMEKVGYGSVRPVSQSRNRYIALNWRIASRPRVQDFLEAILPYLIIKKEQVECLLDLWSKEAGPGHRTFVTDEVFARRNQVENELKRLKTAYLEKVN